MGSQYIEILAEICLQACLEGYRPHPSTRYDLSQKEISGNRRSERFPTQSCMCGEFLLLKLKVN